MADIKPHIEAEDDDALVPLSQPMADEKYLGIKSGIGFLRMIPWPAAPEQWVGIRALSRGEQQKAYLSACAEADRQKRPHDEAYRKQLLEDNLLWYALRNKVALEQKDGDLRTVVNKPEDHLFSSPDDFRRCVDEEQFLKLLTLYGEHCHLVTPLSRAQELVRDQEFETLFRQLKKKPDAIELTGWLLGDVLAVVSFLLERAQISKEPQTSP